MGWTFYQHYDRPSADLVRAELEQLTPSENGWTFHVDDMGRNGSTFYVLQRMHHAATGENRYTVVVALTTRNRQGEFGIKDIGEECGPCECDCPKRILDKIDQLCPPHNAFSRDWRERCRARLQVKALLRKTQRKTGDKLVYGSSTYTLVSPAGARRGWNVLRDDGAPFRMTAKQVAAAMLV